MPYFSERQGHEVPRNSEYIGEDAWGGIRALIRAGVEDGSFAVSYRENCFDGPLPIGTDSGAFFDAMRAHIPGMGNSLWDNTKDWGKADQELWTFRMLDIIEFCWKNISKPILRGYHDFGKHYHLSFDVDTGREEFRVRIEDIFRRNGIAYVLAEEGHIERLVPRVFQDAVVRPEFNTGDGEFDRLLETAQEKFLNPNPGTRREALEALWDAWERVKTMDGHSDKKAGVQAILDTAAGVTSPKFRQALDREAAELTGIGNSLRIRHSETSQEILATSEHVDYLFYRLYSLIQLVLKSR